MAMINKQKCKYLHLSVIATRLEMSFPLVTRQHFSSFIVQNQNEGGVISAPSS